jgi:hypothetical protein
MVLPMILAIAEIRDVERTTRIQQLQGETRAQCAVCV